MTLKAKTYAIVRAVGTETTRAAAPQTASASSCASPYKQVMHLQRTVGNQAVQRLFKSGYVRAKLTFGHPRDVSELEADRVAEQVMRMSDSAAISAQGSDGHEGNPRNQWRPGWRLAKSAAGDDEEIVQPQPLMMRQIVQREPDKEVKSSSSLLNDGEGPLSNTDRNLFAPQAIPDCAGASFHTDGCNRKPTRGIQTPALTAGREVFVAQSAYRLGRTDGRRLLVPILTHATQQGHSVFRVQRQPGADATCNGQSYNPKRSCCTNGKLIPQSPIEDLEECPDRKQLVGRPNEYDGCSVPWFLRIGEDKDNPAGGRDTAFSDTSIHGMRPQAFVPALPCDVHDKCYQTCNADPVARELCDMKLIVDASRVCSNSAENEDVKNRCRKAVEKANYFLVRHGFGEGSFEERQRQYCHCCPLPAHKDKKRQMIANTENVRLVRDPIRWDEEEFILRRLPKGTPVEFLHDGAGEKFNNTDEMYQWWYVRVDGVEGWVMQVLLDEVTGNP